MASRSPFGDADSDEDDDWLNDVAPAASEDVGNASWLSDSEVRAGTGASESSSVPRAPEEARAVGNVERERREETVIAREATETSAFGAMTPRAFGSPRATTPTARQTPAFQATPASPSAQEVEPSAEGGFVEVSNGDLGALFGGDDADDDWMSPTASGARDGAPVGRAAPAPAPPVAVGMEQMSPTQVVHAATGPFASPTTAADPERNALEPVVRAPEPRPASAYESETTRRHPSVHAQHEPFESPSIEKNDGMNFFNNLDNAAETNEGAVGVFGASSTSGFAMFQRIRTRPAFSHETPAAVEAHMHAHEEPEKKEDISYQRQPAFYEESNAPAHEYPQTEFVAGVIFLNKRHSLWRNRCTNPRCLLLRRQRRRYRLLLRLLPRRGLRLHVLRLRRRRRKVFRTPPHTSQWHPFILKNMLRRRNSRSKLSTSRSRW